MKKYFPELSYSVLTTNNPNTFLNFGYELGDPEYLIIPEMLDISTGLLYINGFDLSKDASIFDDTSIGYYLKLNQDVSIATFFVYSKCKNRLDFNLKFNVKTDVNTLFETIDISLLNRPYIIDGTGLNIFESSKQQIDNDTSYLILRTNPKLSGNVKLVIDNKENLFFDTFKVSDILNNKLYRKQKVSANSVFSGDVRTIFSSLPQGELYRLDAEDTLNISLPKTDLYKQYNMNYSYGSRILYDELYDESFGILAPLWINNKLPDYFGLFRINGNFNEETYDNNLEAIEKLAIKFISEGKLINSWGIKEKTNLGTYLRNHLDELKNVISPSFIALSDQNELNPDPNTWYGVAVDKGIITGRSEVPYFFNKKSNNFTDLTEFTTQGFERLNLLCPNLINLEFIFDDNEVDDYTMHRYFGFYLTDNPLYNISYYAEEPDSSINILPLDNKNIYNFIDSSIFDSSTGNISDEYQNRLFTINDFEHIRRFKNKDEINGNSNELIDGWLNKPGINLFSEKAELKKFPKFIFLRLNNLLQQGEHLRINDYTNNIIYEIYGVDSSLLNAGETINYATEYSSINYPTIRRTIFSIKGTKEDQANAIYKAFNVFKDYENTPFEVLDYEKEALSISIKDEYYTNNIRFQRILGNFIDLSTNEFIGEANYDDINFYGTLNPNENDFDLINYDSSFGPIGFELYGDRLSLDVDFFDSSIYYVYSLSENIINTFNKYMLYQSTDDWYRLISNIDISTNKTWELRYSEDPIESKNILLITKKPVNTINNIFNAYSVYPLSLSLMGINPVKDFDTTVYDSSILDFKSKYWYKRDGDLDTTQIILGENEMFIPELEDSYIIESGTGNIITDSSGSLTYDNSNLPYYFNTFIEDVTIETITETIIKRDILDGSMNYYSLKDGTSEENLLDYYLNYDISNGQIISKQLKYGLIIPTGIKWGNLGFDCRGNEMRLNLDPSILDPSINSLFIPDSSEFTDEIFYPSYKYLTPGDRNWKDYIFYDINDSIKLFEDNQEKFYSFKELIFEKPTIDIFSKIVYSNNNVNETILRSSITYFNDFKNSIDTILNGLSLSISINENARNILNIQDWDRYRISAIAVPSMNRDNIKPIEVIINENTKTILIIWYQGNEILNYNLKYSSESTGKNLLAISSANNNNPTYYSFSKDPSYNYIKSPFIINTASLSTNLVNIYDGNNLLVDASVIAKNSFLQMNLNDGDNLYSIFNAYNNNKILGSGYVFDKSYNTFKQYYEYYFFKDKATYGPGVNNLSFLYFVNENYYKEKTTNYNILEYILDKNNVEYYIIKENNVITNNLFSYPPVKIKINKTRKYNGINTYNGWFRPMFNNILNFTSNEDNKIIETTNTDFILGNTNLQSYNKIPQLWFSKVTKTVTEDDIIIGNAIDYKKDFNPFYSQWDSNYYKIDGISIDGYNSIKEIPSYFGSKLPKLPKKLELDSWDVATTNQEYGRDRFTMFFNISKKITNIFKSNTIFLNNWANLPQQSDVIIDGYIKETVLSSYNIRKSSIKIELYTKPYNGSGSKLAYVLDPTFELNTKANVDGELLYTNNEYVYRINTTLIPKLEYFVKIILFEK